MPFLSELRKRKVFRVAAAYLVAAWLAVQVASIALPAFDAPTWVLRATILLVALGFPLALTIAWALELTQDGIRLDMSRAGSKRMLAGAAAIALLAAGWAIRSLSPPDPGNAAAAASVDPDPAPAAAIDTQTAAHSIAVLPFSDISPGRDHEYLADGLAQEILIQLAQIEDLDVRARGSSFSFKGRNEDVRDIGRKLGTRYLLEGSVRRAGEQLRITAQLVRSSDGTHLWSRTYDRRMQDIFAVQDQVAQDVAAALRVKLDVGDLSRNAGGTTSVEAYEKFLQAQAAKSTIDAPGAERAVELLREAVQLDPAFGTAWVSLAQSIYDLPGSLQRRPDAAREELADILAYNLRTAPEAPWTQHLLAYDHLAHYRWPEAMAAVGRVTSSGYGSRRLVDPWSNPPIYLKWASRFATGQAESAFALTSAWVRADPLSLYASTVKIMFLPYLGRDAEQHAEVERSRGMEGNHYLAERTVLMHLLGDPGASRAAVREQFQRVLASGNNAMDRRLLEASDRPEAARAILREAFEDPASGSGWQALIEYADGFGDKELALAMLRKAVLEPEWRTPYQLGYLLWYPYKTDVRKDPRFKALLHEIGMAAYWRSSGEWGDYCRPTTGDDFECT